MKDYSDYFTYAFVALGILLASVGVFYQYSYWWDELYSVTAASLNISEMFDLSVLADVHPPLYSIVLNIWVDLFGSSERATRLLSFIFSTFSLFVLWSWAQKTLDKIGFQATVIFFSTCFLFAVYAQETRAYSMMLFLASLLTVLYSNCWHKEQGVKAFTFFFIAISLSLTHYFGFIYSGLILIFSLYDVKREARKAGYVIIAGLVCFFWPIFHFLNGEIGSKTGDNFWITSDGWQTTVSHVSSGLTPQVGDIAWSILDGNYHDYSTAIIFLAAFFVLVWLAKRGSEHLSLDRKNPQAARLGLLFVSFVAVIALIDYHSPISTRRNYIVILPLFSIIVGLAAQGLKILGLKHVFLILLIGGFSNLWITANSVKSKALSGQDHAGAIEFIENKAGPVDNVYYLAIKSSSNSEMHKMMAEYYASDVDFFKPIYRDGFSEMETPFYLLMQNQKEELSEIRSALQSLGFESEYFVPQNNNSVVVFYGQ